MRYDLAIIGSGAAAFATAISAVRKHKSVVMVEQSEVVGGTCVNVGCIPSKALLAAAQARQVALEPRFAGVATSAGAVDATALIGGKDALIAGLRQEKYLQLAEDYGWQLHAGTGPGHFVAGPALDAGGQRIEADHYLIATGSAPWAPPIEGLPGVDYLTSSTAMALGHVPESLIVIGGNSVGLEQGQLFARLGTKVTILETLAGIAPFEEPEVGTALSGVLTDEGVTVHTATTVTRVARDAGGVVVTTQIGSRHRAFRAEQLLVATGRRPQTSGLGLDMVGVQVGKLGEVVVNEGLRTHNPRIWAAGDVVGYPQFVYVAGAQGRIVADNMFDGGERTVDYRHLPRVTFTSPQVAAVGSTEAAARADGVSCESRVLSLEHVPRAVVNRDTRGLFKIVAERRTGTVLGIHALAEGAGDVMLAGVYALENKMTVDQLASLWCPYLTMAEGVKLTAQMFTSDITKLSCCAA